MLVLSLMVAALSTNSTAQDVRIQEVDHQAAPASATVRLVSIGNDSDTRRASLVQVTGDVESVLRRRSFMLQLPLAGSTTFVTKGYQKHGDGVFEWQGTTHGKPATIIFSVEGLAASFRTDNARFDLSPASSEYSVLREQKSRLTFHDDTPGSSRGGGTERFFSKSGSMTGSGQIDVLFIYAPGVSNPASLAATATSQTNSAISNTIGAAGSVNNVGVVRYPELPSNTTATSVIGHMETDSGIETLRTAYGADVVAAIAELSDYSGYAADIYPGSSNTYLVADPDRISQTGRYTFAHEITHLLGGRHDLANDTTSTPWAWGHGFWREGTESFASIMNTSDVVSRDQQFSTPDDDNVDGPLGSTDKEDIARVWSDVSGTVAGYKSPTTPPSGDLVVSISGETNQKKNDTCEFSAVAYFEHGLDIPCDTCSYSWYSRPYGGGTWTSLGVTTETIYYTLDNPTGKQLRVDVSSSTDSDTAYLTITGDPYASCSGGPIAILDSGESESTKDKTLFVDVYPNPFNPATIITVENREHSQIRLEVFDALGRRVSLLFTGQLPSGSHTFSWNASDLPTGVYFLRVVTPTDIKTSRLTMNK